MTRSDCGTCGGLSQEALSFTQQRARADLAWEWLRLPPDRTLTNAGVLKFRVNDMDFLYRPANKWIVDFGRDMTKVVSALYEAPFAHVKEYVCAMRQRNCTRPN